jgi:hypothetical protein
MRTTDASRCTACVAISVTSPLGKTRWSNCTSGVANGVKSLFNRALVRVPLLTECVAAIVPET